MVSVMATSQIAPQLAARPHHQDEFRCPNCGCKEAYRSQRRDFQEKLLCWYRGVLPYRCRKCDLRFYARKPSN
jgi:rubredoxin